MCNFAPSNKEGIHLNKGNFLSKKGEYLKQFLTHFRKWRKNINIQSITTVYRSNFVHIAKNLGNLLLYYIVY